MKTGRAHKILMKPTREQKQQLQRMFLQTQAVLHIFLQWNLEMYSAWKEDNSLPYPNHSNLCKRWTQEKPEEGACLSITSVQRLAKQVCTAIENHLKNPDHFKLPSYTKKRDVTKYSFYVTNQCSHVEDKKVYIPKVGLVKLTERLRFQGKIMGYHFSWYAGKMRVSIQMETDIEPLCTNDSCVGIDVGLSHEITTSDGVFYDEPATVKQARNRVKVEQHKLAQKAPGSNNYMKRQEKLQRAWERWRNIRMDFLHKATTNICKTHANVCIEDLHLAALFKDSPHFMRAQFADSLMKEVHQLLSYKATRLFKPDRYFASSKTCSHCGSRNGDLRLSDRSFVCPSCGNSLDRDLNAAINLFNYVVGVVDPDRLQAGSLLTAR